MDSCNNTSTPGVKVAYDPGWNDPPNLVYNTQQTTPNRPRNFLNKRVAFPLSNNSPSPAPTPPVNLPVLPLTLSVPPVLPVPKVSEDLNINSEETLKEVKTILLDCLENCNGLGPKANDIKRRICVMEDMWSSGKLNSRIHVQIKELAMALKDDKPSVADDLHRALMVDHVSAVGTWMPGVKQLIHHCIACSELLAIDKEE